MRSAGPRAPTVQSISAADHRRLATLYREKAERFERQALQEEEQLAYYEEHAAAFPTKYPTPPDSARKLAQYYRLAASKAKAQATAEESLASQLAN